MARPVRKLRRFLRELKRRKVYRVAATYALVGFVIIQVADLTFVRLGLPSWTVTFVIVLVALGFPLSLVVAWAFELTPEGMRRTVGGEPADGLAGKEPEPVGAGTGTVYKVLVGLGLMAAAVAGGWYLTGGGGASDVTDRTVAVLPFESLGREEPTAVAEGIHTGIQTRLSDVADLRVTSRTSAMKYRGTDRSLPTIARDLGVRWVLRGEVQESGDRFQVSVRLVDARQDRQVWAEDYRGDLTADDLFDLQGAIAKRISRSLEAHLTVAEERRVESRPTGDLEAYRHYVRGRRSLRRLQNEEARSAFEEAIERDSSYALAWAGLADARTLPERWARLPDSVLAGARTAVDRALELDPNLAEAHASRGYLLMARKQGPAALRALERAVELKPSYSLALHWLGRLEAALGRPHRALRHQRRAVELDPLAPDARESLSLAHLYVGEYGQALAEARRAKQVEPGGYVTLAPKFALLHLGPNQALREVGAGEGIADWEDGPDLPPVYQVLAHSIEGDTTRARETLNGMRREPSPWQRALAHAALGEIDAAFVALRKVDWSGAGVYRTAELRYLWPQHLGPIRADPRFEEILRRLDEAWGLYREG